ncbi:hypothetical protein VOLCADRAFT_100043 [Volvox carteri f. nagariensis]|uniref:Pherophorin domain-containing protein n=1 Tax=Volvox carteri f. nagariensis TaxID=3068 RepID=D8UJ97_VOLCA|nr:uncharacterized protein VOLCADRAFT_100043 [Volvox carteri f. nagariensis]EFJ40182.1 hypothetical protein VOLCADRAFT_100043 [Volvox carteri f. nagariensis]|eukprot:XP_002958726.1 hypothetical protein VOLCADRAFT_100043 [Volvox carteri f. nagariensis]
MALRIWKLTAVLLSASLLRCGTATGATALGGRRLLQNPDFPSQRNSKPSSFILAILSAMIMSYMNFEAFALLVKRKQHVFFGAGNPSWMNGGGSSSNGGGNTQEQSQNNQAQMGSNGGASNSGNLWTGASAPVLVFSGGQFGAGWSDASYGASPFSSYAPAGKDRGTANCHYLPKGAATSFYGPQGSFVGLRALEFWVYSGSTGVADVALVLSGAAQCRHVPLSSLQVAESSSGWVKYWVDFNLFSWAWQGGGGSFSGCGSSGTSAGELVKLEFFNPHPEFEALLCVDNVRLMN